MKLLPVLEFSEWSTKQAALRPPTKETDREASGGPARPAALVGLASTHACCLNRPSRDRTCFDKRCRPCRPVYVPGTWWTGGRGHGGHIHRAGAVFVTGGCDGVERGVNGVSA